MVKIVDENSLCDKLKVANVGEYCDAFSHGETICFFLVVFLTVFFSTFLCLYSVLFLFAVLPMFVIIKLWVRKNYTEYFCKKKRIRKIRQDKIGRDDSVLVVMKTTFYDICKIRSALENLERAYLSNAEENVYFALCSHDEGCFSYNRDEYDKNVVFAKEKMITLRKKYGEKFFLFVKRQNSSYEKSTLFAITNFLYQKSDFFVEGSIKPSENVCQNIRYVFNIAPSTMTGLCAVKGAVETLKGLQKSDMCKHKEKSDFRSYCALACEAKEEMFEDAKSVFGEISRFDYEGADLFSLFGNTVCFENVLFEKKYLYRIFCSNIKGAKKKKSVAFQKSMAFSDEISLLKKTPEEGISYFKNCKTCLFEEIENLILAIKNEIDTENGLTYTCLLLAERIACTFLPLSSMICTFVGLVFVKRYAVLFLSIAFSPYVLPIFHEFWRFLKSAVILLFQDRSLLRIEYTGIRKAFWRALIYLCFLPRFAYIELEVLLLLFYERCVKAHIHFERVKKESFLENGQAELLEYVKDNLSCAVCGAVYYLMSEAFLFRALFLLWFFVPFFAFILSNVKKMSVNISDSEREKLLCYCEDMWLYFAQNVTCKTNYLPLEYISFYGKKKCSSSTSSVAVAFYFLCCAVARKAGFIGTDELEKRLLSCLETLESLKKKDDFLFDRYDIFTKKPITQTPSAFKSRACFFVCIVCTKACLCEYSDELANKERLLSHLSKLEKNANSKDLFDKNALENLFLNLTPFEFFVADIFLPFEKSFHYFKVKKKIYKRMCKNSFSAQNVAISSTSFLFLQTNTLENIKSLDSFGKSSGYSMYGFYDAEFETAFDDANLKENNSFTKRIFAYKNGIYIASIANVLFDGVVKKWFDDYAGMYSDVLLPTKVFCAEKLLRIKAYKKNADYPQKLETEKNGVLIGNSDGEQNGHDEKYAENKALNVTETISHSLPDDCCFTLFGRKISFFARKDGVFAKFVLEKTEKSCEETQIGKITLGKENYDVCENAEKFCAETGIAVYEGLFGKVCYRLEVFAHKSENVIIMRLQTQTAQDVKFSRFCKRVKRVAHIAGGAVTINVEGGVLFLSGADITQNKGANLEISENYLNATFSALDRESDVAHEYVFVIGVCKSEEDTMRRMGEVFEKLPCLMLDAQKMCRSCTADFSKIPTVIRCALEKNFFLPKDGVCARGITETSGEMCALETFLLVYAEKGEFVRAFLKKMPYFKCETVIAKSFYAMALGEYVRLFEDGKLCDMQIGKEKIYRIILFGVFEEAKKRRVIGKEKTFLLLAILSLLKVSDFLCDTRTYIEFEELLKKMGNNGKAL